MKKSLALILAIFMIFSAAPVFAEEAPVLPEKTEISFRVGESTLLINGEEVTVETPYIAGEGTTLVPLRVITEAFGAEVLWDGETKTITLNYPDVTIVLQIDNKKATVNDHTEELPVAPTLSDAGVTMVPLRFISETFGAEVSYEDGLITVTKSSLDFGKTLSSLTDKEKIGDSYQGWTMNTPKFLILAEKTIDGSEVAFIGDDIYFALAVKERTEDYSPEAEYLTAKNRFLENAVLVDTTFENGEDSNGYYMLQCKNEVSFTDIRCHITKDKVYLTAFVVALADTASLDSLLSIADSFKTGEVTDDVYDISDVKDGLIAYENEKMKFSLMHPVNFSVYEYAFNDIEFYSDADDDPYSDFRINIYSVTDKVNAKSLAEADHSSRLAYYNKDFSNLSEITEFTQDGIVFYQYTQEYKNSKGLSYTVRDVFFEKGAYLYNICFHKEKNSDLDFEKILKTLKVEELDAKETGNLLRNDNNPEIMYPVKNSYWSVSLPSTWYPDKENTISDSYFHHELSHSSINIYGFYEDKTLSSNEFSSSLRSFIRNLQKDKAYSDISNLTQTTIGGIKYYTYSFKFTTDQATEYFTVYSTHKDGVTLSFSFIINEAAYTEKVLEECNSILESFKIEYDKEKDRNK